MKSLFTVHLTGKQTPTVVCEKSDWRPQLMTRRQSLTGPVTPDSVVVLFFAAVTVPGSDHYAGEQWAFPMSVLQTWSGAGSPRCLWPSAKPAGGEHHWHLQTGSQQRHQCKVSVNALQVSDAPEWRSWCSTVRCPILPPLQPPSSSTSSSSCICDMFGAWRWEGEHLLRHMSGSHLLSL